MRFGRPALEISVSPGTGASPAAALAPEADVDVAADEGVGETPSWWPTYIERVKDSRIHVGALLHHASASTTVDGSLRIEVPDEFHVRVLREEADTLDRALDSDLGRLAPSVRVVRSAADPAASRADESAPDPEQVVRALCEEYPALRLLMERFGGEIVW